MIDGVIVQDDPGNWIDPSGLFYDSTGAYTGTGAVAEAAEAGGVTAGEAAGVTAGGVLGAAGAGLGVLLYPTDIAPDDLTLPPQMSRQPYAPNKPNRHKQGREEKQKKKLDPKKWKRRCPAKEPPSHTPGREHR